MSDEDMGAVDAEAATQQEGHLDSPEQKQESDQDKNWRLMRDQMDELKRYNQRLESEVNQMRTPPPPKEEEYTVADDDLSTVGITKKLAKKEAQQIVNKLMAEKEVEFAEKFARLQYTDYDAIVTNANLQRLVQTAPELAKMLMNNPDPVGAYKLLKSVGIDASEAAKVQENQNKPRSTQSVGQTSALSQAHAFSRGLTSELKKQLWQEMQEAKKAQ